MKKVVALFLVFVNVLGCAVLCGCAPKLESISIKPKSVEVEKGKAKELDLYFEPQNAKHGEITWKSSDPEIVTVDEEGNIKGLAIGNAVVSAKTDEGIKASCNVTVKAPKPQVLELSAKEATINVGETLELTYTVDPSDADTSLLTWSSSDEAVATVSNGIVTAIAEGTAVITLSSTEGVSASCDITVENKSAFDFLVNYAIENGEYSDSNNNYKYFFVNDYDYSSDMKTTCGLTYEPSTKEIQLGILATLSDDTSYFATVTIGNQLSYPYDVSFMYYTLSGSLSSYGNSYLYPATFTGDLPLTFYTFTGSSSAKSLLAEAASLIVNILMLYLRNTLLTPNGYTLADLGFTSM